MKPGKFGQNLLGALNGVLFCNQSSEHGIFRSKANSALSEVPKVAFFTTFVYRWDSNALRSILLAIGHYKAKTYFSALVSSLANR
jgi:hypothetical protein